MTQPMTHGTGEDRFRFEAPVRPVADRIGPSRAGIVRALNEARARRLLGADLDFIPHPSFDDPACRAAILGPTPEPPESATRRGAAVPGGLSYSYSMAGFCVAPPLTREQEEHLFRKMNYLKYQAAALRRRIDPARARTAELDRLEWLLVQARAIKDRIVVANLRLVTWVARRSGGSPVEFFERVSDGIVGLLRAVDRFDVARGHKFSTYAAWAILNGMAKVARERDRRERFVTGHEELFATTVDPRAVEPEQEQPEQRRREAVANLLGRLGDRERRIIVGRFGIGGARVQTLKQIGAELGISKERVRQIEARARDKLRDFARTQSVYEEGVG